VRFRPGRRDLRLLRPGRAAGRVRRQAARRVSRAWQGPDERRLRGASGRPGLRKADDRRLRLELHRRLVARAQSLAADLPEKRSGTGSARRVRSLPKHDHRYRQARASMADPLGDAWQLLQVQRLVCGWRHKHREDQAHGGGQPRPRHSERDRLNHRLYLQFGLQHVQLDLRGGGGRYAGRCHDGDMGNDGCFRQLRHARGRSDLRARLPRSFCRRRRGQRCGPG